MFSKNSPVVPASSGATPDGRSGRIGAAAAALALLAAVTVQEARAAALPFSAAGSSPGAIAVSVDAFRASLGGGALPGANGSFGGARREINWDGVPDARSAPNLLPADFFNTTSPRGVVFSTPGSGFQLSANAASGTAVEFGNLDPSYSALFTTFSPARLFTAIGSNVLDVAFFVPGTTTAALTRGFGAVFTDVDLADTTSLTFFDANSLPLGTFLAPALAGNETLSFIGVDFGEAIISRVRIVSGNTALGPGITEGAGRDLVAMDDFIYGEPLLHAVPEPGMLILFGAALAGLAGLRRRVKATRTTGGTP